MAVFGHKTVAGNFFDPLGFFGGGKGKPKAPEFQPYTGYRPPHVSQLRPVEDQITKILMERSQGQGVGYDPARRNELLQNFDIQQGRDKKQNEDDIQNRISGSGLSRNPAVYDELIGRANRHADEEKNLYTNRVDIEDLARRNEERDVNTGRLADLNRFNFGQENNAANFDASIYGKEQDNRYRTFDSQSSNYEDPFGSALAAAGDIYSIAAAPSTGGLSSAGNSALQSQTPTYNSVHSSKDPNGQNAFSNYLSQLSLRSGKNFQR